MKGADSDGSTDNDDSLFDELPSDAQQAIVDQLDHNCEEDYDALLAASAVSWTLRDLTLGKLLSHAPQIYSNLIGSTSNGIDAIHRVYIPVNRRTGNNPFIPQRYFSIYNDRYPSSRPILIISNPLMMAQTGWQWSRFWCDPGSDNPKEVLEAPFPELLASGEEAGSSSSSTVATGAAPAR